MRSSSDQVFLPTSVAYFLVGLVYWTISMVCRLNVHINRFVHIPTGAMIMMVSSAIVFMFGILAGQVSAIRREKTDRSRAEKADD